MPDDDLAATFAALGLPQHALTAWLAELDEFCRAHGGQRRYAELMALLERCRDAATRWER
jgi:hypothetical protein